MNLWEIIYRKGKVFQFLGLFFGFVGFFILNKDVSVIFVFIN